MSIEPDLPHHVRLPTRTLPLAQRIQEVVKDLLGSDIASTSYGVERAETAKAYGLESGPFLYAVLALRQDGQRRSVPPILVRLRLAIEVLDGGPSRIKLPSPTLDAGTKVELAPPTSGYKPCTIEELDDLSPGSLVSINAAITGEPGETLLDLTPEDRALLKPAIAALYAAPVIDQRPRNEKPNPTPPTMGF